MTSGDAARFFDAIAGRYERTYALSAGESRRRMGRVVCELPRPPGPVLDLGVGTGRELTALLDAGYTPTGVDVSREMLARCARRARPVPLVHADFWEPLPFAAASFDAVLTLHGSLAHPPHDNSMEGLARELSRVVRPGGAWIAETPSPAWLDQLDALPVSDERSVRRTGPQTCVYEDHVAGASVDARVLTEDQWRQSFGVDWRLHIEPISNAEWLIVATRV
jgi:ubiquinone/menaquinone biosynthesis C-methylase UbiE